MADIDILTLVADGQLVGRSGSTLAGVNKTASTSAAGLVELATNAETVTGTDTARATTPAGVAAAVAAVSVPLTQVQNTQTGTSYTLVLTDANKTIRFTSGTAVTLTVPPNASVALPVGTRIDLVQMGAGQVTVSAGVGVTLNKYSAFTNKLAGQYCEASLYKDATNTWVLTGLLEAV